MGKTEEQIGQVTEEISEIKRWLEIKLKNQIRRSRDRAMKVSLSHILYRYKRLPS